MYKTAAQSQAFMTRTGSYSTHSSRTGRARMLPLTTVMDWDPEQFDNHFAVAKQAMEFMGGAFRKGAAAAAAVAACHFVHPERALDAMEEILEHMRLDDDGR